MDVGIVKKAGEVVICFQSFHHMSGTRGATYMKKQSHL